LPHRLSGAVLRFEPLDAQAAATHSRQFPLYVEPGADEPLLSWLMRLATRLGVSLRALAASGFGMEDRPVALHEWCRPHPWLLMRISQRTGVPVARLRQMTFESFQPIYRDDEASGRFTGRRYDNRAAEPRAYRFVVCPACLRSDTRPHLRREWLIGWVAVCAQHGTVLLERCAGCRKRLQFPAFRSRASFSPEFCTRCSAGVSRGPDEPAAASVARIQAALLAAKSNGEVELDGLGQLSWPEIVALVDVLLGTVWTGLTLAEQGEIWTLYTESFREARYQPTDVYRSRHDSLYFLAWLLEGWPDRTGATIARGLLGRWVGAERNRICRHLRSRLADPWTDGPSNFEPSIRERLRSLSCAS